MNTPGGQGRLARSAARQVEKANAHAAQGRHAPALVLYDEALPVLQEHAAPAEYARALMNRANALSESGRHAEASTDFETALPLLREHAPPSFARGLMNRASAFARAGRLDDAVAGYDEALALLTAEPDDRTRCLVNRANALRAAHRFADALAGYEAALSVFRDRGQWDQYTRCLARWAGTRWEAEPPDADRPARLTEVQNLRRAGTPARWAQWLCQLATVLYRASRYEDTCAALGVALPLLRQFGSSGVYAESLVDRANALAMCNRWAEALDDFEAALPLVSLRTAPRRYGRCLWGRAAALQEAKRWEESVAGYDEALPVLRAHHTHAQYAACLWGRADSLAGWGRLDEAAADYDASLAVTREHDTPVWYAKELARSAARHARWGRWEGAAARYAEAAQLLAAHDPAEHASSLAWYAESLRQLARYAEAVTVFDEALPLLREHVTPGRWSEFAWGRAHSLAKWGRHEEALAGYDAVLPLVRDHASAEAYPQCLWDRAISARDLERYAEALVTFDEAAPLLREHETPVQYGNFLWARAYTLEKANRRAEAVTTYDEALTLLREHGAPEQYAQCLCDRADSLRHLERWAEALAGYDEARPLLRAYGTPQRCAEYARDRANTLRSAKRWAEAVTGYDDALALGGDAITPADRASYLWDRAHALTLADRRREAVDSYDEALPLLRAHDTPQRYARCLKARADVLRDSDRVPEALAGYDEVIRMHREDGADLELGRCLWDRAHACQIAERWGEACGGYDEALPLLQGHLKPSEFAAFLQGRAVALGCGQHHDAVAPFEALLPQPGEAPSVEGALTRVRLADTLAAQGRFAAAVAEYELAMPALLDHAPPADVAGVLMGRAWALASLDRIPESLTDYNDALARLDPHASPAVYARALRGRAWTLGALGRGDEGQADADAGLALLREFAPTEYDQALLSRARSRFGPDFQARAEFDTLFSRLQARGLTTTLAEHAYIRKMLELFEWRDGTAVPTDRADANALLNEMRDSLVILQNRARPAEYAHALLAYGTALALRGHHAVAVVALNQARDVLRFARRHAGTDETTLGWFARVGTIYYAAVGLGLMAQNPDAAYDAVRDGKAGLIADLAADIKPQPGPEPAEVLGARSDLTKWLYQTPIPRAPSGGTPIPSEAARSAEAVKEYARNRDARTLAYLRAWNRHAHASRPAQPSAPVTEERATRDAVQAAIPERWAVVDFWRVTDDAFQAFVLFRNANRIYSLPIRGAEFSGKLDRLRAALQQTTGEPRLDALNDLYLKLFHPLMPVLKEHGTEGLYLIPHDILHCLPLHAAQTGRLYLCDLFPAGIAYLPSADMLLRLPRPNASGRAFVLANPEYGTSGSLPFAQWEGEQLRERLAMSDETCYLGPAGTFAATDRWADCGLVHFSCHGSGDPDFAPRSHLRLADDLLLAHDVLHRKPPLKPGAVVVLNGCQTGVLDERAVDQGMGLMTAFLVRGAGAVLATQWRVEDASAAELALDFVGRVRAGSAPAAALQAARKALREMSVEEALGRLKMVRTRFANGTLEAAQLDARRGWLCLRSGRCDEAEEAAASAAEPLRAAGLADRANELLDRARVAKRVGASPLIRRYGFDNPVFWAPFQLVGHGI